jgi:hypothetical protein
MGFEVETSVPYPGGEYAAEAAADATASLPADDTPPDDDPKRPRLKIVK